MWGFPPKLSKGIVGAATGAVVVFGSWAAGDLLDEIKAKTGWTWLGAATEAANYVRIAGLAMMVVASVVVAALLLRQLLKTVPEDQRDRLLAIPSAADIAVDVAATAAAAAADTAALMGPEDDQGTFQNETLIIPDLVRADDPIIRNKTFINCDIIGPAVIEFTRTHPTAYAMVGCLFHDTDAVLYRLGAESQTGIAFQDCRFVDCRFYKTLLLFPTDAYEGANIGIEGLNWITDPPPKPGSLLRISENDPLAQALREIGGDPETP